MRRTPQGRCSACPFAHTACRSRPLSSVGDRRLGHGIVEPDIALDELDGAIGAGRNGLRGRAREPVDHRATGDEAEQERWMEHGRNSHALADQAVGQCHDDREDHRGGADHRGSDQHRLRGRLEGVARAVVLFEVVLGAFELRIEAEVASNFLPDVRQGFDHRQFEDRLRVVGHRSVGVDRDRHRAHAEEAEGHQAEGEHRRGDHQAAETVGADPTPQFPSATAPPCPASRR